jgi:hypothetical protein
VIERPDSVRRVMPPTITMMRIIVAMPKSQCAIARGFGEEVLSVIAR